MTKHPAKFSEPIIDVMRDIIWTKASEVCPKPYYVLDPFAGAGGVHALDSGNCRTYGIELEPEWALLHPRTDVGDALHLNAFDDGMYDAIVTSPCYGNRMADRDMRESVAGTYAKSLGRVASQASSCHLQWGTQYRRFHALAWQEAERVLKRGGTFVLNISDHIRGGKRQHVTAFHVDCLSSLGFTVEDIVPVRTRRMKNGANAAARVDAELVIVLRKAAW